MEMVWMNFSSVMEGFPVSQGAPQANVLGECTWGNSGWEVSPDGISLSLGLHRWLPLSSFWAPPPLLPEEQRRGRRYQVWELSASLSLMPAHSKPGNPANPPSQDPVPPESQTQKNKYLLKFLSKHRQTEHAVTEGVTPSLLLEHPSAPKPFFCSLTDPSSPSPSLPP